MDKIKRKQRYGSGSFGKAEISILEGAIMSAFFPEGEEMTIKEIQKRVDYSYERINSALKSLTRKKIITEKHVGKTLVYSLDLQNLYAEVIGFNSYMLQREIEFIKKHKVLFNAIKKIENIPYISSVILFGSYSKGTETTKSDVDLICLSYKKKETEHFVKSLRHEYNFEFAPVVLQPHEFPNIKKDNLALWNDLKIYGVVFKEGDYFYWMYKDGKN